MKRYTFFIIAIVAFVNALGYGIIIPVLYSYSQRFGLTDFQNGLLFSLFSICQFLASPLIGRLSDRYGRKPLLLISIAGTAVSFLMMAFAPNAIFLVLARALDGLTAGNLPVASAVISDTTDAKNRAKGFGVIGASFGFGFVFGPAISALTLRISPSMPFLVAAGVAIFAVVLTAVLLPETNIHRGQPLSKAPLIDIPKLVRALFDVRVGTTLLITLIYSFAFSLFIYAFQPFSVKILRITEVQISEIFTVIGIVGLLTQVLAIPRVVKRFGDKRTLTYSLILMTGAQLSLFFSRSFLVFLALLILNTVANSFIGPMIQTLLSKEVDEKSQGFIQGINASYASFGMILGPIFGGVLATLFIPLPFVVTSLVTGITIVLSLKLLPASVRVRP